MASVWQAWQTLNASRTIAGGMVAIPAPIIFSEIYQYALCYEVDDFDRFVRLIKMLDANYIGHSAKAKPKKSIEENGDSGIRAGRSR